MQHENYVSQSESERLSWSVLHIQFQPHFSTRSVFSYVFNMLLFMSIRKTGSQACKQRYVFHDQG